MFSSRFWESDFESQKGFDCLVSRLKDGNKTCKELEDFLKQRAKAEEEFGRALQKIAKGDRGPGESGTLKSSLDVLRTEAEYEANLHLKQAQSLSDEANKLMDFREKQREERKRHEDTMHKAHKSKNDSYKKLLNCKSSYENKYRAWEKAESDYEKTKFSSKPKEGEKAKKVQTQSHQAMLKADEDYQNSVQQLEHYRQQWENDHLNTCESFQRLEEDRIKYLRNAMWIYSNIGSDLFVESDDSRERMRLSLEHCDIDRDLIEFSSKKGTGTKPLDPIFYIPCGGHSPQINHQTPSNLLIQSNIGRPRVQDEYSLASGDTYSSIPGSQDARRALYAYEPQHPDEMRINEGDILIVMIDNRDGWVHCMNKNNGMKGLVPKNYLGPVN